MAALPPYIPATDSGTASWSNNFSTLITANPATYGLVAADATAIAAIVATWATAYALVLSPSTKTPTTVSAKNTAKINLLAVVRPYAQTIALNAGVASSDKTALGLNPRTSTPTPITAPTTNPILSIISGTPLVQILRYRDSAASPSVKSKPYGVTQVQLFASASATPITDPSVLGYHAAKTKSPLQAVWQSGDVGKVAYYAARYITRTGLVGPWSPVVSMTIA